MPVQPEPPQQQDRRPGLGTDMTPKRLSQACMRQGA